MRTLLSRLGLVVVVALLAVACGSGEPQVADRADTSASSNAATSGSAATDAPATDDARSATDTNVQMPRAGDPVTRADGSIGELEEGTIVVVDGVSYVVQARDYDGPPVRSETQVQSQAERQSPPVPEIDLPEAPDRLTSGLSNDQLMALFADMHGPTSSIAGEMQRLVAFPAVLDSSGDVLLVAQRVEFHPRDGNLLDVKVIATYETLASMAETANQHHSQLVAAGHAPREIETETENGVDISRSFRSDMELPGFDRARASIDARPSRLAEGFTSVNVTADYRVGDDWEPFQQLQSWSELPDLSDGPLSQLQYVAATDQQGVLNASLRTRWLAPEPVDEAVAIAVSRSGAFEPTDFDKPDYRWLSRGEDDDFLITAREHWEGTDTELSLSQLRPLLVWDERQPAQNQPAPDDESETASGELVELQRLLPQGLAEITRATTKQELAALVAEITNTPAGTDSIAELNRLAPFPATIEFPSRSTVWALGMDANYVDGDARVQALEYRAIVSVFEQDVQQLYDFFTGQMAAVNATDIDENVTRTSDGVVQDADLQFVVNQDGILFTYLIELSNNRFEIDLRYTSLTEPDYVALLASYVSIDLPVGGPLVAAGLGNDRGPLGHMVAVAYDQETYPFADGLFADLIAAIEQTGTLTFDGTTSLSYELPEADVRVSRDEWGFAPGLLTYEVRSSG